MTTKHEAALRAQAAEYAERMMRREWRVVPQAGIEPGDGRGNWYIEAIDTRFGMHSLVMWAYQSKSAYDRAFLERVCDEHNATIRDALTAQGEVEKRLAAVEAEHATLMSMTEKAASVLREFADFDPDERLAHPVAVVQAKAKRALRALRQIAGLEVALADPAPSAPPDRRDE